MTVADFGRCMVETDIDRAVIASVMYWLPTYLAEAERQRELPSRTLARPKDESFQNALTSSEFPDGRLPAILVTTARTVALPLKDGDGSYFNADYTINVSAVVRGKTPPEAREVASVFGGCVRWLLVHQQTSLDGEVEWTASSVIPVPDQTDQGRWLAAGLNTFVLHLDDALTGAGPTSPVMEDPIYPPPDPAAPDEPYDDLVEVTLVTTSVTNKES